MLIYEAGIWDFWFEWSWWIVDSDGTMLRVKRCVEWRPRGTAAEGW